MKHKVFIVIDHLGEGGTQRQIIEYLKQADKAVFDFMVVNLDAAYNTVGEEIRGLGVSVVQVKHSGFLNFRTLSDLVRLFRKEKPSIVYTYLFTSDCYGRLAAKLAGVPVILCAQRAVDKWKKPHHILADWLMTLFTDKVTINAEGIREFLVKKEHFPARKIVTIYNGIDLRRFEGGRGWGEGREKLKKELSIKPGALVVGMVGRFDSQKDYATFFAVAEKILPRHENVVFVAVGAGPLLEHFRKSIGASKFKDNLVLAGLRRDVPDIIHVMDICVLASHYEGCPNVILEYMACSKPVVASDVGGCKELVTEGQTGYIVSESDPVELAKRIETLLSEPELREKMGLEGRRVVEECFTSEIMARKTEALFLELLNKKS